jgi:hypothetical protein
MADDNTAPHESFDALHPAIYKALVGIALWLVLAAWIFFGTQGYYATFTVAVVTGFFVVATAVPYVLWRVWRKTSPEGRADQSAIPFSEWWHGEMETWQCRVEGWDAAVEVLLPLGIAAFGMTAIGLVFRIMAGG